MDINYTDVGSSDVLFETKGPILKLAAGVSNFKETNITVITSDNYCYSFIVNYREDIAQLNYFIDLAMGRKISVSPAAGDSAIKKTETLHQVKPGTVKIDSLVILCEKSLKKSFSWWDEGAFYKKVYFSLNNIFVYQDQLFFVVSAGNLSNIDYDIDYLKLNVTDKKRTKRSSIQDIEKLPVFSFLKPGQIKGKTKIESFVINAHPLTIGEAQQLAKALNTEKGACNAFLKPQGILPVNVLHINPSENGSVLWHTRSMAKELFFTDSLGIPNGKASIPSLLWFADKRCLRLFALATGRRPKASTPLYHAPFFNISDNGNVCMGTIDVNTQKSASLEEFIAAWENYFFNSYFSHLMQGHNPVNGNCVNIWKKLIKTGDAFPNETLLRINRTFKDLLR